MFPYTLDVGEVAPLEFVTCKSAGICPDGVAKSTCSWMRMFMVQCQNSDPPTYTIYTNGLPNHCYYAPTNNPFGGSNLYVMTGKFNVPPK